MAALAALLVVASATAAIAVEQSAKGVEPPADGVVVLRNGNVLAGAVRQVGNYYRVEAAGATLQVPVAQVEMRCRSLDEAYQIRRNTRGGSTADSHIELARWCLRQNMLDHVAQELLDARTLDPGHPALPSLQLQLDQINQNNAAKQQALVAAPAATSPPREVVPASASTPAIELSTEARTQFVRSIQPMLIHTCATAGCHQPGAPAAMQLDRWALVGNGNATLVRRNLAAVVQWISVDKPDASPLLVRAQQEHGATPGMQSKPLEPLQQKMLLQWINDVAGVKPPDPAQVESVVDPAMPLEPGDAGQSPIQPQASSLPLTHPAAAQPPKPFVPRDAFDGEIFNRRVAAHFAAKTHAAVNASPAQE